MRLSANLPVGVGALLFESARQLRNLERELVKHLEGHGFSEVILPVVDYLDPYEKMLDAVGRDELYSFVDRDGELLVLRADFTPMLARLIADRLRSLELPLKLFYRGDVLRYQHQQPGSPREFYQLGAEILGIPGEEGEQVALRHFLHLLTIASQERFVVVLGFAGALDSLILKSSREQDPSALAEAIMRRERSAARSSGDALLQIVTNGLPDDLDTLGPDAVETLERLDALRHELSEDFPKMELRIDLAEFADQTVAPELEHGVGARAYYDGMVFRAFTHGLASPIGGGGRYDRLFRRLGAETDAVGFGLSLDRLTYASSPRGKQLC